MDQSPRTLARARALRRAETEAEKQLWGYLRDRRLGGFKFRRQVPISPYVADFTCVEQKLIVEIDGATHGDAHEVRRDEARTAYLEAKGFRVLRVQNLDVFNSLNDVLDCILIELKSQQPRQSPHPPFGHLPPTGEG